MNIRDHWERLDPATQKWLLDNPGCQILPRTLAAVVSRETGEDLTDSQHGEKVLSPEDHEFIRAKANEGSNA